MASLITHPIVPLALAMVAGRKVIPPRLLVIGLVFSMLPDLDAVAFRLGIPYASPWGHRGFSHSILIAVIAAALVVPLTSRLHTGRAAVFCFLAFSMCSHGALDAATNGGKGVAFIWPFNSERIFFDFRPIEASPISVQRFLSGRGIEVLSTELVWVWIPALVLGVVGLAIRRMGSAVGGRRAQLAHSRRWVDVGAWL